MSEEVYRLTFSGVTVTEGERFALDSVSFGYYDGDISYDKETYPAGISSCLLSADGKSVSVKASVTSSFVLANIDKDIALYAVDMWGGEEPV